MLRVRNLRGLSVFHTVLFLKRTYVINQSLFTMTLNVIKNNKEINLNLLIFVAPGLTAYRFDERSTI